MILLLVWGVFSLILSPTQASYQYIARTKESFNIKSSTVDFSNVTVISDGFGGTYWNNDSSGNPAVVVDSNDIVHVVWDDFTSGPWGTDLEIMYANYTIADGWSNATVISDGYGGVYWNNGPSSNPAVAVDSSNKIHVVWMDLTNGPWGVNEYEIMYVNYTNVTGWSNPTVISDGFGGVYWNNNISANPSIAVDNNKTVHVVWEDRTEGPWGADSEIMYVNYTSVNGWSNVTVISDGFDGVYWNYDASYNPVVAVGSSTAVHVVWMDLTDGPWGVDSEIMYTNFTTATGWSNITVISDGFGGNGGNSYSPAITVDNNNLVHVVWSDGTGGPWGGDTEIMYANFTNSTSWSDTTVISDGFDGVYWNIGHSYSPAVEVDSSNTIHVVWYDNTDGPWDTDDEIMYTYYMIDTGWSNASVISDGFDGVYWNDGASDAPAISVDSTNTIHVVWHDNTDGLWGTDSEIMYTSIVIPAPVIDTTPGTQGIPYGNFYLLFIFVGLLGIIIYVKRKI